MKQTAVSYLYNIYELEKSLSIDDFIKANLIENKQLMDAFIDGTRHKDKSESYIIDIENIPLHKPKPKQ